MKLAEHPAKSVMARRWEERRAQASARWADQTASVVLERAALAAAEPVTTEVPSAQHVLADLQQLEQKTTGRRAWLSNTQRAMLIVVLVSNSVLAALLWGGGFLQ